MNLVSFDTTVHVLSLVVRIDDHFTGAPIREVLDVRVVGIGGAPHDARPVRSPSGSPRQADGTYRFVGLPAGDLRLSVLDPQGWWLFHEPSPTLTPPPDPRVVAAIPAWPSAIAPDPPQQTRIRGRLLDPGGAPLAGRVVRIAPGPPGAAPYAVSDRDGEFVFPVTGPQSSDPRGLVALQVAVAGGTVTPDRIAVRPSRATRARFEVA